MTMNLNILWFILIATLFCVYFFLDGMDFGIGMLVPFLGKSDADNKKMIYAIGPTWGANEVWLLTAGGAMFAAFPGWYATMFSGFYPALFLLLAALIIRGISIEFREKTSSASEKKAYNIGIFIGNLLTPLLLVVAIACLLRGVPIDQSMEFTGNLFSLFSPFTLLAGLTAIAFFIYHGAVILNLKLPGELKNVKVIAQKSGIAAILLLFATMVAAFFETAIFTKPISAVISCIAIALLVLSCLLFSKKAGRILVVLNALFIVTTLITVFSAMFPNVMVSSTNPDFNLTVYNVASGQYTLSVISIVTLTLLPIVIGYTCWTYYVFAKKIEEDTEY